MTVRELVTVLGFKLDDAALKKYDKQIDSTKAKSNSLAKAAKGIGTAFKVAGVVAGVAFAWVSKNILSAASQMEQARNQLQKFTGTAEGAAAVLAELRGKTADPLFGTDNLVSAYKQLRNLGMGAQDTSNMIDVLGDVADGSVENFNALGNILTRVSVSGKVNEGTLRQLTNAGFGLEDMAHSLGKSTKQLEADIAAGRIGFNELTLAMSNATKEGGRFYQNMERQARTFSGSIKILKSTLFDIGEAIGTKVLPKIVDTIRHITNLIKLGKDGFVNFGAKAFEMLINAIQDVIIFFQLLQMRMKKFGGAFTPLKGLFADVFGFMRSIIESAYPLLMNLAQLFLVAFKPIKAFVTPVLESLKGVARTVFGFLSRIVGGLIPVVNGLTPVFSGLGKVVGGLLGPVLGLAVAIKGVNTAIAIGRGAVATVKSIQTAYALLTGTMSVMKAAAEGNRLAMLMLDAQMLKSIIITKAKAAATAIASVATKIWAGVQAVFNAIMMANPIALIILGVIALIAAIILLVKNWDKVKAFFVKLWENIKNIFLKAFDWIKDLFFKFHPVGILIKNWDKVKDFFKGLWEGIKNIFAKVVDFVKKNFLNIINVLLAVMFLPAAIVMAVVRLIIKHWDKIKPALTKIFTAVAKVFEKVWNGIKRVALGVWEGIKNAAVAVIDGIKFAWQGITAFFSRLWEGIKNITATVWEGIKNLFFGVVDAIKNIWLGIVGFFTGLWDALKQGPREALEYIKNAFFALFDNIKEKFLGFINVIRDGWDRVKGFFGGIKDGVVNFVTGGGGAQEPKQVNDLIVTPQGQYSTHPEDYVMAMKNPGDLLDMLMDFLSGGQQMQPAYAGAGGGSLAGNALSRAAANTYNNSSNTSNTSNITAPITVSVNASGMSPEAASAAVKRGVQDALAEAVNTSRGTIQSPEARRG
jgi:phage-related protein